MKKTLAQLEEKREQLLNKIERLDDLGSPHLAADLQLKKVTGAIKTEKNK